MTYISEINQTVASNTSQSPSAADNSAVMGKQDFLTLLVAQLQNQDPLNPDDPTEFTAQLAQFSSLEQLFTLNEGMAELAAAQTGSQRLSALSLIGKEVTYFSSDFQFNGEPVELGYQLDGLASDVQLIIQTSGGATVKTIQASDLTPGNHFLSWDGTDMNNIPVAHGDYKVILQASSSGENSTIAAAPLIRSEVTGVDLSTTGEGTHLLTQAGEVSLRDILGVYDTPSVTGSSQDETESASSLGTAATETASAVNTVADTMNALTGTNSNAPTDDEQSATVN